MPRRFQKKTTPASEQKPLTYEVIDAASDVGKAIYERLYAIVDEHHTEISNAGARIGLAWAGAWKPDADGHLKLGECRKVSDLDREVYDRYDFLIVLNKPFWQDQRVTDVQRSALIDHECCHMGIQHDAETGEPKVDGRGRTLFRVAKHDIEEFSAVVARHGCYKADLESFARAIVRAERLADDGWISYTAVHETLKTVGIDIPATTIATWPDAERREVHTWALLRQDIGERVNPQTSQTLPACVAAALGVSFDAAPPTAH